MPPTLYSKDEKVLCFHHEILYDAKILDIRHKDAADKKSPLEYQVHYKGWKNTWDDWVLEDRLRKATEENRELATNIRREAEASLRAKNARANPKKRAMSDRSSVRDSEERGGSVGRANKRVRENDIEKRHGSDLEQIDTELEMDFDLDPDLTTEEETESTEADSTTQEETFITRPSVRIVMPDNLKSLLVDDWERVTKNGTIVSLPAPKPIRQILQDWRDEEAPKREDNRIDIEVLDEVVAGLSEYFDKMLDKILLYRYERPQYRVFRKKYQDIPGKGPIDVYGAEHLIRLFSSLPELIAQTNMDLQATSRMREEISKLSMWLSKNSEKYFRTEYISATDV